jgi:hypothetical protein
MSTFDGLTGTVLVNGHTRAIRTREYCALGILFAAMARMMGVTR